MGCKIFINGIRKNLTATFVVHAPKMISIRTISTVVHQAHSYYGVGASGIFASLNSQMTDKYSGSRHDKFDILLPTEGDYILVNYGPIPVDPYANQESIAAGLAGSGTYRFSPGGGKLTSDIVNTMGLPSRSLFQDADQSSGKFLSYLPNLNSYATPEYFIIPGIQYQPCMKSGGCPPEVLDRIHNATHQITLSFIKVDRLPDAPLSRVPLRQVGNHYTTSDANSSHVSGIVEPSSCPCGFFHSDGRMLGVE